MVRCKSEIGSCARHIRNVPPHGPKPYVRSAYDVPGSSLRNGRRSGFRCVTKALAEEEASAAPLEQPLCSHSLLGAIRRLRSRRCRRFLPLHIRRQFARKSTLRSLPPGLGLVMLTRPGASEWFCRRTSSYKERDSATGGQPRSTRGASSGDITWASCRKDVKRPMH
jgi:hypothetical protein